MKSKTHSPEFGRQERAGLALLLSHPDPRQGVGSSLFSPWTSAWSQVTAQTKGMAWPLVVTWATIIYAYPLLLQGHRYRHGPLQQHGPGYHHHGLRRQHRLLTSGCSYHLCVSSSTSPDSALSDSLSVPFLHHILAHHSGAHSSMSHGSRQTSGCPPPAHTTSTMTSSFER